jgi:pimeloyl-ACP methyl ester carboxylesterase
MKRLLHGMIAAGVVATSAYDAAAQSTAAWRDPSPHQMRFVTVDSNVRLEVLDWGGGGRPLVLIGCYLTAHAFDDIAPKLAGHFRVYAITRRGVGASDHPAQGYDPQRRADDVLEVITQLGIRKPILAGHSCGGAILHTLGARHRDRIAGLAYLDGAEDPTLTAADYEQVAVDVANVPQRVTGQSKPVRFPEAERRQLEQFPLDTAIRRELTESNRVKPDYAAIRVPVMAIYRTVSFEQALEEYPPKTEKQRTALSQAYRATRAMLKKWQWDLRRGVPGAKIVELPGADLYMFLSNEAEIIRELRSFASSLPRSD